MSDVHCLFALNHAVPQRLTCPRHSHSSTEIVFNIGGSGTLFHGKRVFEYGPHSVFVYQPGQEHWITQREAGRHVCFGVSGCGAANVRVGSFPIHAPLAVLLELAEAAWSSGSSSRRDRLELVSGLICLELSERYPRRYRPTLAQRARLIMDASYRQRLTMTDIAAQLSIGADYLRQVFRAECGESPRQYLLRRRIEAATEILRHSTLPIQDVARECGFEDAFYFTRQFRRFTGHAPSALRAGAARV